MLKFEFTSIDRKLTEIVELEMHKNLNTLFILPTIRAKKYFEQKLLSLSILKNCGFLEIEEFKNYFFLDEKPIIEHFQRQLLLYSSMNNAQKDIFRINDFMSAISFLNQVLQFWEELHEEETNENKICELLIKEQSEVDWQITYLKELTIVKVQYEKLLNDSGLQDKAFRNYRPDSDYVRRFHRIVFLNHFYYTAMEKRIIREIANEVDVLVYYQLQKDFVDVNTFSIIKDIDVNILENLPTTIIYKSEIDNFVSVNHLLSQSEESFKGTIIDLALKDSIVYSFIKPEILSNEEHYDFSKTKLFSYLKRLYKLLCTRKLIDDYMLYNLFDFREFLFDYPISLLSESEREETISIINNFLIEEYIYFDEKMEMLDINNHRAKESLEKVLGFIKKFTDYKDFPDFISFLKSLISEDFCNKFEIEKTDIVSMYIEMVESFSIFRKCVEKSIIDYKDNSFCMYLGYFLAYSSGKRLTLCSEICEQKKSILTLQDTRNIDYKHVAVFGLTNDVLPGSARQFFILSDNQRHKLGLRNSNDIKNREKYYFFRLLANCQSAVLYTHEDGEENVDISSVVEEIRIKFNKEIHVLATPKYRLLFSDILVGNKNTLCFSKDVDKDFFRISNRMLSTWRNTLILTPSSVYEFLKSGISYYNKHALKLSEQIKEKKGDYSGLFTGNFLHLIYEEIWNNFLDHYKSKKLKNGFYTQTKVDEIINVAYKTIMLTPFFILKSGEEYSKEYFRKIYIPISNLGIKHFFNLLIKMVEDSEYIEVFAEQKAKEKVIKLLINNEEHLIKLHGRIDLLIRTENKTMVFDYKTGKPSNNTQEYNYQLLMYYELNDRIGDDFFLYYNDNQVLKKLDLTKWRIDIIKEIEFLYQQIFEEGIDLEERKYSYEDVLITRRDLYKKYLQTDETFEEEQEENE